MSTARTAEVSRNTAETQITINGVRATIADLKAGMPGGATYSTKDNTALAVYGAKPLK